MLLLWIYFPESRYSGMERAGRTGMGETAGTRGRSEYEYGYGYGGIRVLKGAGGDQ